MSGGGRHPPEAYRHPVMSSSRERPEQTAPRAPGLPAAPHRNQAAYHDAYLDGLFTYCLSLVWEHDAATAALGEALALAERLSERRGERGRRAADPELLRCRLYALARWACLRRLSEERARRRTRSTRGDGGGTADGAGGTRRATGEDQRRRRELAALAWPEAAGTSPEQREALELAVRHQLSAEEISRVLRLPAEAAHTLLTSAACEVERTRGALAAVASGGCPAVAPLAGEDRRLLLRPGMRGELVRHVDECRPCRGVAQLAMAHVSWPGTAPSGPSRLAVLPAPRSAVHAARLAARRARAQYTPRYDRAGFPLEERDRAARRERLRSRAVTTTVVATVLAAPVLALWAAYRAGPVTGEAHREDVTVAEAAGGAWAEADARAPGEGAGSAGSAAGGGSTSGGTRVPDRPVSRPDTPSRAGQATTRGAGDGSGESQGPQSGQLAVDARSADGTTRIILTASGGAPVRWTASTDAAWLMVSSSSGTLRPGGQATVTVSVDAALEPSGPWEGRITVEPAATVVTVEGDGSTPPVPDPEPQPGPEPEPSGSPQPTGDPDPSPDPGPGPGEPSSSGGGAGGAEGGGPAPSETPSS